MREVLQFVSAGTEVARYHTVRTLQAETVGHHSHGVALLCLLLRPDATPALLKAALVHDLAEHQLGDLPSPAKKKYGIGEQVNALEAELLRGVGLDVALTGDEQRTLKIADILQGMMFCRREIDLGNNKMRVIFERYCSYAEDMMLVGRESVIYSILRTPL